jgi:hypothetical protein
MTISLTRFRGSPAKEKPRTRRIADRPPAGMVVELHQGAALALRND